MHGYLETDFLPGAHAGAAKGGSRSLAGEMLASGRWKFSFGKRMFTRTEFVEMRFLRESMDRPLRTRALRRREPVSCMRRRGNKLRYKGLTVQHACDTIIIVKQFSKRHFRMSFFENDFEICFGKGNGYESIGYRSK